jgi:hypothetical protein
MFARHRAIHCEQLERLGSRQGSFLSPHSFISRATGWAMAGFAASPLGLGCAPAATNREHRESAAPSAPAAQPEAWATADQSTVPPSAPNGWLPDRVHPIKERGCAFGGAVVPVCTRHEAEAFNLTRVGRLVRLRGLLVTHSGSCTQANCSAEAPYCNRLSGQASIDVGAYRVMLDGNLPPHPAPDAWPPLYRCVGDRSAQCCGFDAMGEEILAQGTLKDINYTEDGVEHHQPSLEDAHICRLAPPTSPPTNRYVTDTPPTTGCQ